MPKTSPSTRAYLHRRSGRPSAPAWARSCPIGFGLSLIHISNELGSFLRDNLAFFQGFESVIVYYDNGQALVTDLINTVLCAYLTNVDVRKIAPYEYRLSQAADMVCTLELMREKSENGAGMSKSEFIFFESRRRDVYKRQLLECCA